MAPLPHAVHHQAMATDGKYVYVFGGRESIAGTASDPVNFTQVYNPATNVRTYGGWVSAEQGASRRC
jgi:hypothetical protein